jgi:hypothetical protein
MALTELGRFYSSFEAGVARSRFAADGIETFLFDMEMSWEGLGGLIPIRLMVAEEDRDLALEILDQPDAPPR